jgi:hypothetical protein
MLRTSKSAEQFVGLHGLEDGNLLAIAADQPRLSILDQGLELVDRVDLDMYIASIL